MPGPTTAYRLAGDDVGPVAALDAIGATADGIPGHDTELTGYSAERPEVPRPPPVYRARTRGPHLAFQSELRHTTSEVSEGIIPRAAACCGAAP